VPTRKRPIVNTTQLEILAIIRHEQGER